MDLFHYNFIIPNTDNFYEDDESLETVESLESRLIKLKKNIDNYYDANRKYNVWNVMSRDLHHFESVVVKSPLRCVSRAFYKLLEILISYDIKIKGGNTLHLCEAPGGFIQASLLLFGSEIESFLTVSAESTIKYHKDIKKIQKGHVLINDITLEETSDMIFDHCPEKGYALITADGAFDVSDSYEDQENKSYDLLFNEISVALSSQQVGGCFVIKMFDCILKKTWNLITWLRKCYKQVYICKPPSSRPVNSEKYCVCINFVEKFTYSPCYNRIKELPNFREFFLKKSLHFQILKLEEVFHHINLSEDPQSEKLNARARQNRIKSADDGEKKYLKVYGKYLTPQNPPSFCLATVYQ